MKKFSWIYQKSKIFGEAHGNVTLVEHFSAAMYVGYLTIIVVDVMKTKSMTFSHLFSTLANALVDFILTLKIYHTVCDLPSTLLGRLLIIEHTHKLTNTLLVN